LWPSKVFYHEGDVTREDFGRLLNKYYELFNLLAIRQPSLVLSGTVILNVNVCIDYGYENGRIN